MVLNLKGIIVSGKQGSTKWMPEYLPNLFPGTLNVHLYQPITKINWSEQFYHQTFQRYFLKHPCKINNTRAFLIVPPLCTSKTNLSRMKNPNLAEIAHAQKLREMLNLSTGDEVEIEIESGFDNDT